MTKEQIFEEIDEIYCNADGGVIPIGANGEELIKEIIQKAINYTHCCTELKCLMEEDKPNCHCELNHCDKQGW